MAVSDAKSGFPETYPDLKQLCFWPWTLHLWVTTVWAITRSNSPCAKLRHMEWNSDHRYLWYSDKSVDNGTEHDIQTQQFWGCCAGWNDLRLWRIGWHDLPEQRWEIQSAHQPVGSHRSHVFERVRVQLVKQMYCRLGCSRLDHCLLSVNLVQPWFAEVHTGRVSKSFFLAAMLCEHSKWQ